MTRRTARPMSVLGSMSDAHFLRRYWQREPLLVRGALQHVADLVDGDELAGLACEDAVDARLVIHDAGRDAWQCEDGPFDAHRFATLPARGWTLLVQAVDQHMPGVAALLERFAFLPRWRLDDVMVSYASDGGGVGPHFDHYDVFLIQARGARRWQIGQRCDAHSALRDHPRLKLLADFTPGVEHELHAGDMLYLPPGIAHQGTALGDECITCSVGFRAPAHAELLQGAAAQLAAKLPEDARYRDSAPAIDADPYCINETALRRLRAVWDALAPEHIDAALAHAFGCQLTEPRHPERIGEHTASTPERTTRRLSGRGSVRLAHDPASRFAYAPCGERALLFVDGEAYHTSAALARGVCHARIALRELRDEHDRALLLELLAQGSLSVRGR